MNNFNFTEVFYITVILNLTLSRCSKGMHSPDTASKQMHTAGRGHIIWQTLKLLQKVISRTSYLEREGVIIRPNER